VDVSPDATHPPRSGTTPLQQEGDGPVGCPGSLLPRPWLRSCRASDKGEWRPAEKHRPLQQQIDVLSNWNYEFDFGNGVKTPIFDRDHVNRDAQRRTYVMSPLVELCEGNLAGKRVLDFGCNAGFWSLQAVESACDFVLGVDGRNMHIDQAELVVTNKDVPPDRYSFLCGDILSVDFSGFPQFDVVLCLGLLYHVATPVQLFNLLTRVNSDPLVIDTEVSLARRPSFDLRSESLATAQRDRPRAGTRGGRSSAPNVFVVKRLGSLHSAIATSGGNGVRPSNAAAASVPRSSATRPTAAHACRSACGSTPFGCSACSTITAPPAQ